MRASGFGLLNAIGRVSSFVTTYGAGALLEVALWAPLVVAAVLLALGSLAMMMLPEPAGVAVSYGLVNAYMSHVAWPMSA